jgi:hypothetical protein
VLAPVWFFGGFFCAILALALFGRRAATVDYPADFTRFHPIISPEENFYPTVAEMCAIVRAKCKPDQVLVISGGNSIHYGVGQPPGKVWTDRLQRLLGNRYCVINFAFRGSVVSDSGAVIAEVLRKEFPKQIYVANTAPVLPADPIGSPTYRYLFWDAYFKGLLAPYLPRDERVRVYFRSEGTLMQEWQIRLSSWTDAVLHYRDFWNWLGYEKISTLPTPRTPAPPAMFSPKKRFGDEEPDSASVPFSVRFRPENEAAEMAIVRAFSESAYQPGPDGRWTIAPDAKRNFEYFVSVLMPDPQKHRTLIVVSQNSPLYLKNLSPRERDRNETAYRDTIDLWTKAGYVATTYQPEIIETDYVDRTHLTSSGGDKLAGELAPQIEKLAETLGYFKTTP